MFCSGTSTKHPPCQWLRCGKRVALALCALGFSAPLFAQRGSTDRFFASVPFQQWMAGGEQKQIPWRVELSPQRLSVYQRLTATIEVFVPGKELLKRADQSTLCVLLQITDAQGRTYQDHTTLEPKELEKQVRKEELEISWITFFVPGQYSIALALYDRATQEYSFTQRSLSIRPLEHDPMPRAWSRLPAVELPVKEEGLDDIYKPKIAGMLHLPLATRRSIEIELVMNLTPSEILASSRTSYMRNLGNLLPALKSFSQIEMWNGSLNVATLDLTRRQVSFEQQRFRDLDWPKLRQALLAADPSSVDVVDLQGRAQNESFLRDDIQRRLAAPPRNSQEAPLRVFIFVSSPMAFVSGHHPEPVAPPEGCDCLFYYLQYSLFPFESRPWIRWSHLRASGVPGPPALGLPDGPWMSSSSQDDLEALLKPLKPKVFQVGLPGDFRNALATILADVSRK